MEQDEYCTHKQNYWKGVYDRLIDAVDEQEMKNIQNNLNGEVVEKNLEVGEEYFKTVFIKCRELLNEYPDDYNMLYMI